MNLFTNIPNKLPLETPEDNQRVDTWKEPGTLKYIFEKNAAFCCFTPYISVLFLYLKSKIGSMNDCLFNKSFKFELIKKNYFIKRPQPL